MAYEQVDMCVIEDLIPQWALSPPDMVKLSNNLEALQGHQKAQARALDELQRWSTMVRRAHASGSMVTKNLDDRMKPVKHVPKSAPALVLIDCESIEFCADRLASGREGGKKFIDDLARIVENRYAETRKEDDPKEIWLTFEIFLSEAMGREGNMREFLIGISDAINVKLVRVYGENTTSLAWKLAVTAQNWFEGDSSRYCYLASCDEKAYGCFNRAHRTRLRLLVEHSDDTQAVEDSQDGQLEEEITSGKEQARKRSGFEVIEVGDLLTPRTKREEAVPEPIYKAIPSEAVISTGLPITCSSHTPLGLPPSTESLLLRPASSPASAVAALSGPVSDSKPPGVPKLRSAFDLVRHSLGQSNRPHPTLTTPDPTILNTPPTPTMSYPAEDGRIAVLPEPSLPAADRPVVPIPIRPQIQQTPSGFGVLYQILVSLNGDKPNRYHAASTLGPILPRVAYRRMGFTHLKQYLVAAERNGIIRILERPSHIWVALRILVAPSNESPLSARPQPLRENETFWTKNEAVKQAAIPPLTPPMSSKLTQIELV